METKDYAKMFRNIKDEILGEIKSLVPVNCAISFDENFIVRYCEGETALVEYCVGIEVSKDGNLSFIVQDDDYEFESEPMEGEALYCYDNESLISILEHLKKEVREEKLAKLREIVKQNGGKIEFDGSFLINIDERNDAANDCAILDGCRLKGLGFCSDGTLAIRNIFSETEYTNEESALLDEDLDKLIAYVERQTRKKFVVRVYGTYSRTFDIEASSYEEALAEAKKDLEINPIRWDDLDEGNWEDFTSRSN